MYNKLNTKYLVCDSITKRSIIDYYSSNKLLYNFTFLSMDDLIDKIYGSLDNKAVIELMDVTGSFALSKEECQYLKYLIKDNYKSDRLNKLLKDKEVVDKYITKDTLFFSDLARTGITFINPIKNKMFEYILGLLKDYNVQIYNEEKKEYVHEVSAYTSKYEECLDVMNKIVDLRKENVSFNNISIINIDSEYEYILRGMCENYNIPIKFSPLKNITHTKFGKCVLDYALNSETFISLIEEIKKNINDNDYFYLNKLIAKLNEYDLNEECPKFYLEIVKAILVDMPYMDTLYEEEVSTTEKTQYNDNEYVFYLGFNLGVSPKTYKDDKFLTDVELNELNLDTSVFKNAYSHDKLVSLIKHTKNLYLSCVSNDLEKPSQIATELKLNVVNKTASFMYSENDDKIRIANSITMFNKYGDIDATLKTYDVSEINGQYNIYSYAFSKVCSDKIKELINGRLNVSYSYVKDYFYCPFRYYCNKVLKLDEFINTFPTSIGNYAHNILQDSANIDFDFEKSKEREFRKLLEKNVCSEEKAIYYTNKIDEIVKEAIEFNKEHELTSRLQNKKCEEQIYENHADYFVKGQIDKFLYNIVGDKVYVAIIDYKTGSDIASLTNVRYGFNLQLPIYAKLIQSYKEFKDKEIYFAGIYLQKVCLTDYHNAAKKGQVSFKLKGFSNLDSDIREELVENANVSTYIDSFKLNKNGSVDKNTSKKTLSNDDFNELVKIASDLIENAVNGIFNAEFQIDPIVIKKTQKNGLLKYDVDGCDFCKYNDVCMNIDKKGKIVDEDKFIHDSESEE